MVVGRPESPGFCQYVCQCGSCFRRRASQIDSPAATACRSATHSISRASTRALEASAEAAGRVLVADPVGLRAASSRLACPPGEASSPSIKAITPQPRPGRLKVSSTSLQKRSMARCYPSLRCRVRLDPDKPNPYHQPMDQDLSELEGRIEQLLGVVRKLAEQNQSLRAELDQAATQRARLQARMGEARTRVQAVLDRLPRGDEAQLALGLNPEPSSLEASDSPGAH